MILLILDLIVHYYIIDLRVVHVQCNCIDNEQYRSHIVAVQGCITVLTYTSQCIYMYGHLYIIHVYCTY